MCVRERERQGKREGEGVTCGWRGSPAGRRFSHIGRTRRALRHRANMVHIRQSRPDSGLGVQVKVLIEL